MDLYFLAVYWLIGSYNVIVRGQISGVCNSSSDKNVDQDGIFELHTFIAQEGILQVSRKIIGEITILVDNLTNSYAFEEPYFKKPYNRKMRPTRPLFDVVFINVAINGSTATSAPPHQPTTKVSKEHVSVFSSSNDISLITDPFIASSGDFGMNNGSTIINSTAVINTATVSSPITQMTSVITSNMTSSTITTAPIQPAGCVLVQIVQIYDLDREESDTHYLTLTDGDNDLGIPIMMVRINVTDINDNSPVFVKESLSSRITKDVKYGDIVAEIKAVDADTGKNADLRYDILQFTERRGDESESPSFPTFMIHQKLGLVVLLGSLDDLKPSTDIVFSVTVKDRGDDYVGNRATATATISVIDDTWVPEVPSEKTQVSSAVIAGCVMGGVIFFGIVMFIGFRCARKKMQQQNGQLAFMLDDENLISA